MYYIFVHVLHYTLNEWFNYVWFYLFFNLMRPNCRISRALDCGIFCGLDSKTSGKTGLILVVMLQMVHRATTVGFLARLHVDAVYRVICNVCQWL